MSILLVIFTGSERLTGKRVRVRFMTSSVERAMEIISTYYSVSGVKVNGHRVKVNGKKSLESRIKATCMMTL